MIDRATSGTVQVGVGVATGWRRYLGCGSKKIKNRVVTHVPPEMHFNSRNQASFLHFEPEFLWFLVDYVVLGIRSTDRQV